MSISAEEHVVYRIATAPLRPYPFPHIYVDSVFPAAYYAALRLNWPQAEASAFWREDAAWMGSARLRETLLRKFEPFVRERFGADAHALEASHELQVGAERADVEAGVHTGHPDQVISAVFYCPQDAACAHLGTSIYLPVDPSFRCPGGIRHPYERFHKMATMACRPNMLFAFAKTDRSFHGIDRAAGAAPLRDVIRYDVYADADAARAQAGVAAARGGASLGLRLLKNMLGLGPKRGG